MRDTDAAVGNGYLYISAVSQIGQIIIAGDIFSADFKPAAFRHRLAGIHDDVVNRLADLTPVHFHRPEVAREMKVGFEVGTTQGEFRGAFN